MRSLSFEDRQVLERRWADGENAVQIAKVLGVCSSTVYVELRRGDTGELDSNFRRAYSAARGQRAFQESLSRRGRREKIFLKGGAADGR